MYDGVKTIATKIDIDVEFERYLDTIQVQEETHQTETKNILRQLFLAAFRVIFDYRWIPSCEGCNLSGTEVSFSIKENENGNRENEILGKWMLTVVLRKGKTKQSALRQIEADMERHIRKRYDLSEPGGI